MPHTRYMREHPPHANVRRIPLRPRDRVLTPLPRSLVPPTSTRLTFLGLHHTQIHIRPLPPQLLDAEHGGIPSALPADDTGPLFFPLQRARGEAQTVSKLRRSQKLQGRARTRLHQIRPPPTPHAQDTARSRTHRCRVGLPRAPMRDVAVRVATYAV